MILDRIFGSKGRVALFTALFDGQGKRFHIRELARKMGLSAPSLMREAKSLVAKNAMAIALIIAPTKIRLSMRTLRHWWKILPV